ncbi:MAG: Gfo/Idh/MocA family protein [Acidimicrobiales bacterium]
MIGATSVVATEAVLPAIASTPAARLVAVASRDGSAAEALGRRFGAARHYGRYEDVLADPDVEAVYVPLPNGLHREWTERAAAAGRAVLCEKPLAPTAADAEAMAEACRAAGTVLLEAYMTPYHPRAEAAAALLAAGGLGTPRHASATFTFTLDDPGNHRWLPAQGGGALLDVGVYCVSPLLEVGGGVDQVTEVAAHAVPAPSGVDATFSGWLAFAGGCTASFVCSFEAPEHQHLEVVGTDARLDVELPFAAGPAGTRARVHHRDGRVQDVPGPDDDPYRAMVDHFAAVVRGRTASRRPPAQSVALLGLFDRLRSAAGAAVPGAAA